MPKKATSEWHCRDLKKGTFIIFRQITSSRIWKKRISVGEIVSDYNEDEDLLAIHITLIWEQMTTGETLIQ